MNSMLITTYGSSATYSRAEYDIAVEELNENSPRVNQPDGIRVELKPHQLSAIYKCISLENDRQYMRNFTTTRQHGQEEDSFCTKIGIIGDTTGSGKSFIILSVIMMNNIYNRDDGVTITHGYNNVIFNLFNNKKIVKTNILVFPHNLLDQWTKYVREFADIKYIVINKRVLSQIDNEDIDIGDYDLVLLSATFYNRFIEVLESLPDMKFQRIFFDEIDHMNISGSKQIDTKFTWLVTASYGNLIYPRGYNKYDPNLRTHIYLADGLNSVSFIRNILHDLYQSIPVKLVKLLVVKNSNEFIQSSLTLPSIIKNIIRCKTPLNIHIITGIVDQRTMECLYANDIPKAMSYINNGNIVMEDNIVNVLLDDYKKQLSNLNLELTMTNRLYFSSEHERITRVERLSGRIHDIEGKIKMINDRIDDIKLRIEGTNICMICYDDIQNKSITKCCQNSFCFKCIHMWLAKQPKCPVCKAHLDSNNMYFADNGNIPRRIQNDDEMSEDFDKYQNLQILLKNREPGSKFLIFSNYDTSFNNIFDILRKLYIRYQHLQGNSVVIKNMIDQYKNSNLDVLLVNAKNYGSGLNLENTTDIVMFHKFETEIEQQVLGRAHRVGRTSSLRVWYLLYKNE